MVEGYLHRVMEGRSTCRKHCKNWVISYFSHNQPFNKFRHLTTHELQEHQLFQSRVAICLIQKELVLETHKLHLISDCENELQVVCRVSKEECLIRISY